MMKHILSLIFCLALALPALAQDDAKSLGDSAYARDEYERAIKCYALAPKSAAVLYNVGNCYYRMDSLARAILYYERALLLSPGNEDIRFNLTLARGKTVDKLAPRHEFFFVGWYRSLCNVMSVDAWAWLAVSAFVLSLVALLLYLFVRRSGVRRVAIAVAVLLLFSCIFANLFAYSQRSSLVHRTSAIVMTNACSVKSTPSASGKALFVLHEGTRVEIIDDTLHGWYEVELQDGKKGWMEARLVEII